MFRPFVFSPIMNETLLNKDVLGVIFSFLPGQYSTFVRLCHEAKNILKTDGWDALIAHGVSVTISEYDITWYKNGLVHRDNDLPAMIYRDCLLWHYNGNLHRDGDKPAIISRMRGEEYENLDSWDVQWSDEYYKHGKRHRYNDKPAVVNVGRSILEWYVDGELHRDGDLPAYFEVGVMAKYCKHGKLHRNKDMPASIYCDDTDSYEEIGWCRNGDYYRENGPIAYAKTDEWNCSIVPFDDIIHAGYKDDPLYKPHIMWDNVDDKYIRQYGTKMPDNYAGITAILESDWYPEDFLLGWKENITDVNILATMEDPDEVVITDDDIKMINDFLLTL